MTLRKLGRSTFVLIFFLTMYDFTVLIKKEVIKNCDFSGTFNFQNKADVTMGIVHRS